MSKGSNRRPTQISRHEEDLRWKLAFGKITFNEFERRLNEIRKQERIKSDSQDDK